MSDSRIPEGWEHYTSERDYEEAWRILVRHKQDYESLRPDVMVRVKALWVPSMRVHWLLRKVESRVA